MLSLFCLFVFFWGVKKKEKMILGTKKNNNWEKERGKPFVRREVLLFIVFPLVIEKKNREKNISMRERENVLILFLF